MGSHRPVRGTNTRRAERVNTIVSPRPTPGTRKRSPRFHRLSGKGAAAQGEEAHGERHHRHPGHDQAEDAVDRADGAPDVEHRPHPAQLLAGGVLHREGADDQPRGLAVEVGEVEGVLAGLAAARRHGEHQRRVVGEEGRAP